MRGRIGVIWEVAKSPALRRVELSYAGYSLAEYAVWLALLLFAYADGGVARTGQVATVMLIAGVVAAPFASFAGDRFAPGRALALGYGIQALTLAATVIAMEVGANAAVYLGAVATSAAFTFTRPVIAALLPQVARRPADLVGANVVVQLLADLGMFLGPLTAAGILIVAGPSAVVGIYAIVLGGAALITVGLRVEGTSPRDVSDVSRLGGELTAGLRILGRERGVRSLVALLAVGAFASGVVDVLVVVFAELRLGESDQAGLLAAAFGLGAVLGSMAASSLIGGSRLVLFVVLGGIATGPPVAALAGVRGLALALVGFAAIGLGQSMLLVAGTLTIQRRTPGVALARVFGLVESMQLLAMAAGASAVAVVVDRSGMSNGLVALGVALTTMLLITVLWLVRAGAGAPPPPAEVVERLSSDIVFAHVDLPTLEHLAHASDAIALEPGAVVITEGEPAHHYFMILDGSVMVNRSGTDVEQMGAGTGFGEIALLRDVPRTATVTTCEPTRLLRLDRDDFLETVTGLPRCLAAATEVADDRYRPE